MPIKGVSREGGIIGAADGRRASKLLANPSFPHYFSCDLLFPFSYNINLRRRRYAWSAQTEKTGVGTNRLRPIILPLSATFEAIAYLWVNSCGFVCALLRCHKTSQCKLLAWCEKEFRSIRCGCSFGFRNGDDLESFSYKLRLWSICWERHVSVVENWSAFGYSRFGTRNLLRYCSWKTFIDALKPRYPNTDNNRVASRYWFWSSTFHCISML